MGAAINSNCSRGYRSGQNADVGCDCYGCYCEVQVSGARQLSAKSQI